MTKRVRLGVLLLGLVAAFAIVGPLVSPDPMVADDLAHRSFMAPTSLHLLGTDQFSRDIMARLARGARTSLEVAILAVAVAAAIGSALGLAAANAGPVGRLLQRVIDLGLAIPRIIVLLVVLAALGKVPPPVLGLLLGATGWPAIARLVRGEALRIRQAQFVTAARALGARSRRIVWLEVFPGTIPAVLIAATLGLADAILLEAGLSFMGVGVAPPEPSWGGMINDARPYLASDPWLLIAPCVALVVATSAATLLADALRRSLQPETR